MTSDKRRKLNFPDVGGGNAFARDAMLYSARQGEES